jgi:hypothetical protein
LSVIENANGPRAVATRGPFHCVGYLAAWETEVAVVVQLENERVDQDLELAV